MNPRPADCPVGDCDCRGAEAIDTCSYRILVRVAAGGLSISPEALAAALAEISYTKRPDPWEHAPSHVVVPGERQTRESLAVNALYSARFTEIDYDDFYSGLPL